MRFADLKAKYTQRFDANDPGTKTMLDLFEKAES